MRIKLCSLHRGPQGSCCSLSPQGWTGLQLSFAFVLVRPPPGTHWGRGRHGTVSSPCTPWDQLLTCHSWICSVPPPPLHCLDKHAQMLLGSLKTGTAHRSLCLPQPHWGIFTFSDSWHFWDLPIPSHKAARKRSCWFPAANWGRTGRCRAELSPLRELQNPPSQLWGCTLLWARGFGCPWGT